MSAKRPDVSSSEAQEVYDCVIAGAGYTGLALALALIQAIPALKIAIVDPRDPQTPTTDERASAIAEAGRKLFQALGIWQQLEPHAQAIVEMIITDSELSDTVRPVFLTFDGQTQSGEPFAHMVANKIMVDVLCREATKSGVTFLTPDKVTDCSNHGAYQNIQLDSGMTLKARLLIAADGVRSFLRQKAGIKTVGWRYNQSAIVATISHSRPHHGRAEEHFLPTGPFALLPLSGQRSSLVWTELEEDAKRLVATDEATFCLELQQRVGLHLGELALDSKRQCFPLGLMIARDFIKPRFALLGDAAHGIHPIAGQGLNLGLRDVAGLAEIIVNAIRLGRDIGGLDVLDEYQRWRRFDTVQMGATTDILNRLFSNNNRPLRLLRSFGLGVVDRMPALKRFFVGEAAGYSDLAPKLLRGEAL